MTLKEIFENNKTIVVYGMSKNSAKPSNYVPMFLYGKGYNIIPVNPTAQEIEGLKCYPNLLEIPEIIDILNVFRPSEQAFEIVKEALERKKEKNDIKVIWLQEGIINNEAKELAEKNGIEFVQDHCMFKEYNNLNI